MNPGLSADTRLMCITMETASTGLSRARLSRGKKNHHDNPVEGERALWWISVVDLCGGSLWRISVLDLCNGSL